jgi:hypothetical protein
MVSELEIEKAVRRCDTMLANGMSNPADARYIESVRDILEWVLGNNDHPLADYKSSK